LPSRRSEGCAAGGEPLLLPERSSGECVAKMKVEEKDEGKVKGLGCGGERWSCCCCERYCEQPGKTARIQERCGEAEAG